MVDRWSLQCIGHGSGVVGCVAGALVYEEGHEGKDWEHAHGLASSPGQPGEWHWLPVI